MYSQNRHSLYFSFIVACCCFVDIILLQLFGMQSWIRCRSCSLSWEKSSHKLFKMVFKLPAKVFTTLLFLVLCVCVWVCYTVENCHFCINIFVYILQNIFKVLNVCCWYICPLGDVKAPTFTVCKFFCVFFLTLEVLGLYQTKLNHNQVQHHLFIFNYYLVFLEQ